jgi:hypothetical protein
VAEAQRDTQMLSVIIALREEVLAQVSEQLPPAARVLDLALRQVDKDQRLQVGAGLGWWLWWWWVRWLWSGWWVRWVRWWLWWVG